VPTYDYRCSSCGIVREYIQKMSDAPLTECPECGGDFRRIITSVGIIFKGSGFHINDYKGKSSRRESDVKDDKKPAAESTASETSATTVATPSEKSGKTEKPAAPEKSSPTGPATSSSQEKVA